MHSAAQRKNLSALSGRRPGHGRFLSYHLIYLLAAILLLVPAVASAADLTIFGPKKFEKRHGKPTVYSDAFTSCNSSVSALLRVQNGDGTHSRIRSGRLYVNGVKVVTESDFKQKVPLIEKEITVRSANELKVSLKSGYRAYSRLLREYDSREDRTEMKLARLSLLKKEVEKLLADLDRGRGIAGDRLEKLNREVGDLDRHSAGRHGHFEQVGRSLDDDFEDDDDDDNEHNSHEPQHDRIVTEKAFLERHGREVHEVRTLCDGLLERLHGRDLKWRDQINALVNRLKDLEAAIAREQGKLAEIEAKIEALKRLGPPFVVVEIIGHGCGGNVVISAPEPGDGTLGNNPFPRIAALYAGQYPGTGIDPAAVRLQLDGSDVTAGAAVTASGVTYTPTTRLADGEHGVTLSVADPAYNSATLAWRFTVDTVAPLLTVSTLGDGSYTKNGTLNISGSAQDASGLSDLRINDAVVPLNADGSFTQALVLQSGANTVTVQVTDRAGNQSVDSRKVYLDQTVPGLVIDKPADNGKTAETPVEVSGTVDEQAVVQVTANGNPLTVAISGSSFTTTFIPVYGANTIEVTAIDPAQNTSSQKRSLFFDDLQPTLTIDDPPQDLRTRLSSITLHGTVADALASTVTIAMDGQIFTPPVTAGSFDQALTFTEEKSHAIVVTAQDEVGNSVSVTRNVIYDITPPALTIDPVVTPTNQASQTITGSREAGATVAVTSATASCGEVSYPTAATWQATVGSFAAETSIITVTASDAAGNSSEATTQIVFDTTPPTVAALPAGGLFRSPRAVTLSASEAATIYYTIDGSLPTASADVYREPLVISTSMTLNFFARDTAGNDSAIGSGSYLIDTVPPAVKIVSPADGQYLSTPAITLTGTLDDPTATVTVNGQPATAGGPTFTATLTLTEGANPITVSAIDPAGNSGTDSITLNLDTIPPSLTVSTLSDGSYTSSETLNVSGTVTDGGGLDRLLINGAVVPVNPDNSYSHALILTTGANTITVEAIDKAANKSTNSRTVNLDQAAPKITVTTPADNSKTGVMQIEVAGTVDEPVSSLTVNGQPVTVNGLSFTATVIPAYGYNTIEIIAKDLAGNPGSQKRTVIFDDKKPAVAITVPAQDLRTNIGNLLLKGTATDADGLTAVSVTVALDGASFTPTVADGAFEQALTFTEEKSHTIVVTARDEVGNETVTRRNVIYDVTPPQVTVTPFDLPVNQASQTIGGSREAGTTVVITSATAVIGTITYPTETTWQATVTGLGPDSNDIVVTIVDAAGNPGSAATRIVYDSTPPVVTVTAPTANAFLKTPQLTISGTISEPVTAVTVNGQPATVNGLSYTAPLTLAEGANSITVSAIDRAGNSGTLTVPVVLDTVAPVITVTAPTANAFLKAPQLTVSGSVSEPVTAVTVNGQPATVGGLSFTATITLAEGANGIVVSAIDRAGNSGTLTVPVVLDTVAPVITVTAPTANAFLKTPQLTVSGSVSEPVTAVTVNGQPATVNGLSFTATITLTEGANSITVSAIDRAGNSGTAILPVTLDTLAPTVAIAAPASGLLTRTAQVTVSGTVSEENTTVTVNAQAATVGGLSYTAVITLVEGQNILTVTAADRAGNSGSAAVTVNLDATAPQAPLLAPLATPTNVAGVTVSGTAEAGASVRITIAGAVIATVTADSQGNFTLPGVVLSEGENSIVAIATDAAGNASQPSAPLAVLLDTVKPVITVTAPQTGAIINTAEVTISGTVSEPVTSVSVNGQQLTVNDLTFTTTMALAAGANSALIVATDPAGNSNSTTLTIQRDSTPPVVTITAPQAGLLTRTGAVQVTGTVDDAEALLTVNGQPITANGTTFSFTYTLSDGDNSISVEATDKAGNRGSAGTSVTLDATLPLLAIGAPAEATAGANIAISLSASDNRQLTLVELRADGVPIWSAGSTPALAETIAYRLSPTLSAGAVVTLQAKGGDSAGNEGSATAVIRITAAAMGPGYLQGKVLEDGRGLKLEGAEVLITQQLNNSTSSLTAAADGGYFLETPAGSTLVKVAKPGYTTVERLVTVIPEKNIAVLDARLTKIDANQNIIDAAGGTARVGLSSNLEPRSSYLAELTLPAGALGSSADLRLTPISNQGLAGVLPLGWSPLAAVDIRSLDPQAGTTLETTLAAPATLTLPIPAGVIIDPVALPMLARYDAAAHQWLAVGAATVAADGLSASAEITAAGQYAFVTGDPAPAAPPTPASGSTLQPSALSLQPDFALITASGKVVPHAAPPSTGLKAAGEVVLTAREGATPVFTSGLVLTGRITEKFDLKSGDRVETPVASQDLILYRTPCATNIGGGAVSGLALSGAEVGELRTTFPVAPSKDYSIVDLLLGKVGIEILKPDTAETGVMVGPDGGRLVDADGNILNIPPGALGLTTPVATKTVTPVAAIGSDFTLIRAVELNLTRQALAQPATLAIPAPAGFDPSLPLIVARQIDVKGVAKLKIVALARQNGTLITTEPLTQPLTNSTTQLNTSGVYCFLQAKAPIGFVTGTISDAANLPFTGALVKTDRGSLVDLSAASGAYLLAAPVAPFVATALDLYKGDETTGASAIAAASQAVVLDLKIEKIPPTVVSVSPANGAVNVQPTVPVVVTFSKQMDQSSINAATLKLINSMNSEPVPGSLTFSVDSKTVTFYPADPFVQETGYTLTIAAAVKDLQGYPLGRDVVSTFTVRRTTPPPMPPAGSISGTFPDADGFIGVTATQGSAPADCTVLLINDTSGEIVSVTPQSNGSFSGRVRGQLGDEIKVVLMDYSGNQTLVSYITFKSNDGKYFVTAKGGKVEGEGGSLLEIPEGALVGPAVIRVTALPEANLPHPVPTGGTFLAAVNVDSGGFNFNKEVHLSVPVPSNMPSDAVPFLARPTELANVDGTVANVYEIIDSTKIVNGRITTASPPFDGVMGFGTFVFLYANGPFVGDVIVSGTAYRDMDGLPGYTKGIDQPVRGAVIRSPQAENFVSFSKADGHYATFGFGANGSCRNFPITATHPLTMNRISVNITTCEAPYIVNNLNFKLADKDTNIPDKAAPVIDINMTLVPGQTSEFRISAGTAIEGTKLNIPVTVIDEGMGNATLTVKYDTPDFTGSQLSSIPLTPVGQPRLQATKDKTQVYRYDYMPQFSQSYFIGAQPGLYTFTVEATDTASNKSTKSVSIRIVPTGTNLGTSLDGPPTVDYVLPAAGAEDVQIISSISAIFSEPIDHVDATTFKLIDKMTGETVPVTVYTTLEDGRIKGVLIPKSNLFYEREYEVRLTKGITDTSPNQSANNAILPLKEEYIGKFKTMTPHAYDLADDKFENARDIDVYTNLSTGRSYAYVAADTNGYRVVDVTDPTKPAVVYPTDLTPFSTKITAYRGVAANQATGVLAMTENIVFPDGNQYGYVRFYDVATNPAEIKTVKVGQEKLAEAYSGIPGRVALNSNYAYIATAGAGLQVVDIEAAKAYATKGAMSDGSTIAGAFDSIGQGFGSPNDIVLYGDNKGILTTNPGMLLPLEITVPGSKADASDVQPVIVTNTTSFKPEGHSFTRVAVASEYIYSDEATGADKTIDLVMAGTGQGKLVSIDITDPYRPKILGTATDEAGNTLSTYVMDVSVNKPEGLAYATTFNSIQVFDIKNPNKPKLIKTITQLTDNADNVVSLGSIPAIMERNGLVYVASKTEGIKVMDMVSPIYLELVAKETPQTNLLSWLSPVSYLTRSLVGADNQISLNISDYSPLINNNDMPTITANLYAKDSRGNVIDLSNATVSWTATVEYTVNLKVQSRNRKGLQMVTPFGPDGFILSDQTIGPTWPIKWGTKFGGGSFKIYAQANINGKSYQVNKPYLGIIGGSNNDRPQVINYLKGIYSLAFDGLFDAPDFLFALACVETGIKHFSPSRYGDPKKASFPTENTGGDGGFGVLQLTEKKPTYLQIWNWGRNIDEAYNRIIGEKLPVAKRISKKYSKMKMYQGMTIPALSRPELKKDLYSLYRGGHYYKWGYDEDQFGYAWIPRIEIDIKSKTYTDSGLYEADKAVRHEGKSDCVK